jgi:hypothetical protein
VVKHLRKLIVAMAVILLVGMLVYHRPTLEGNINLDIVLVRNNAGQGAYILVACDESNHVKITNTSKLSKVFISEYSIDNFVKGSGIWTKSYITFDFGKLGFSSNKTYDLGLCDKISAGIKRQLDNKNFDTEKLGKMLFKLERRYNKNPGKLSTLTSSVR